MLSLDPLAEVEGWLFPGTQLPPQQKAAGAALSAKRGETEVEDLKGASTDMYESMSEEELEELASTRRKGLPEKKGD